VVTGKAAKVEVQTLQPKPTEDPMTDERMALVDLLQKSGDGDFLRAVAEAVLQILMEADVEGLIGAGRLADDRVYLFDGPQPV
jgi:hypothetical protein